MAKLMKKGGDGEREREDLKPRLCHWGDGKREREGEGKIGRAHV